MITKYSSLQGAFYDLVCRLKTAREVNSRGSKQKELIFCNFSIEDPTDISIEIPLRKFSTIYALAEWLWYVSANPNVANIGKLASIWNDIADKNNEVESNYGLYLVPQWNWAKIELVKDTDSRRATLVINQPYHKTKNENDYPCTQYIQFFIRDKKLHMGVSMRSNDLIFGFCNDVYTFCLFQQLMLNDLIEQGLDISLGSYFHHVGSLHVYERHYEMVDSIVSEGPYKESIEKFKLKESFVSSNCLSLPGLDMEKSKIRDYVKHAKGLLFHEYS